MMPDGIIAGRFDGIGKGNAAVCVAAVVDAGVAVVGVG